MTEQQRKRFSDALVRLAGDEDTLVMLANMVAEDAPPMLRQLGEHATASEASEYARTAHALKGLLSTFEMGEPVSELQPIIDAARAGAVGTVHQMHSNLVPELKRLLSEINDVANV